MDPLLELSLVDWSFSFMCCWNLTYGEAAVRPTYALPSTNTKYQVHNGIYGNIPRLNRTFSSRSFTVVQGGQIIPTLCLEHAPGGIQVVPTLFSPIVPNFPYPLQFLVTDCTTCFDRSYAARMIPDGLKASHFNILINIRISRCLGMLPTCFGTLAILLEVWTKQYQLPRYNYLCENFQQKTYSTGVYVYYLGCVTTVPQVEFPASSYRKLAGSASREEWSIGPVPFPLNVSHDDPWISDIERG